MKMSRRAQRMERHHKRSGARAALNLVSLMDIFTILVFFLLVNSSDGEVLPSLKSVTLPESAAEQKPRETVVVMVTDTDVLVQGRKVATVDALVRDDASAQTALKTALEEQAARVLRPDNAEGAGEVTVMGHKEIPYRVLKKVMLGCTQAHYRAISLAVLQKPATGG